MRQARDREPPAAGRRQLAPSVFAAGLSIVCIAAIFLGQGWGFYRPPLIVPVLSDAASVGDCLAGLLAIIQTAAVAAWAPWIGAHAARPGPGAVRRAAIDLAFFLLASLPIATAAWLAGGWDLNAIMGLYLTTGVLGAALAAGGAAIAAVFHRTRVGLIVLSAGCLLTLASARRGGEPPLQPNEPTLAFVSPGYGLTLFFRGHDLGTSRPRPRDWAKHLAALAAPGALAGAVATRRRNDARPRSAVT